MKLKDTETTCKILPTASMTELYWYSDAMIIHMPKDALEHYEYTLVYSKKKVTLQSDQDRRLHNSSKLTDKLMKNICRISLRYLSSIGLVNYPVKIDSKFV